jgi:hypothetical protein
MFNARRKLWVVLATLAVAVAAAAAVAVAGEDSRPTTRPVAATFVAHAVQVDQGTCVGTDGPYLQLRHGVFEGTSTSTDPRFNGRVQIVSRGGLVNLATGYGTDHGYVTWWDAAGRRTAFATYRDVVSQGTLITGLQVGWVATADGLPGGLLVANLKATFDAQFNITGEFGGAGDPQTPAIIQSGSCGGSESEQEQERRH